MLNYAAGEDATLCHYVHGSEAQLPAAWQAAADFPRLSWTRWCSATATRSLRAATGGLDRKPGVHLIHRGELAPVHMDGTAIPLTARNDLASDRKRPTVRCRDPAGDSAIGDPQLIGTAILRRRAVIKVASLSSAGGGATAIAASANVRSPGHRNVFLTSSPYASTGR